MSDALRPLDAATLLSGIAVVELSHTVAGAYCGKVLAQLGASVTRCGPVTDAAISDPALAPMQQALHGGKTSVALADPNLAQALLLADIVVVEPGRDDPAFRATVDALIAGEGRKRGSRLVVLSPGVDEQGELPGCGLTSAAWSGMSWAIGDRAREPLTLPADVPDYVAGVNAVAAALAALLAEDALGKEPVSIAGRDILSYYVGMLAPNHIAYGRPWRRAGRRTSMSGGMYPCGLFRCADGFVVMYCRRDSEWQAMLAAMGNPPWSRDPRFADPRIIATQHADEADGHLTPWLLQHARAELIELGLEHGFAVGAVKQVAELFTDEQFLFRRSFAPLPEAEGVLVPAAPWRLYEAPNTPPGRRAWPVRPGRAPHPSCILEGIRVLDLSWVWSGPLVTSILSDLGAEVIKIEHPSHLDSVRLRGRPLHGGTAEPGPPTEVNPWFNQLNHGKLSAVVDIKSPDGQADIRRLARSCDVVVENMRPGALSRSGLGYADLARANPSLIMLSMSMVGAAGPLSQMKGYAGIMSAAAGLESLVGYRNESGEDEITGMMMTAFGDPNAAMHAISVLLAALHRRRRTGRGVWIDLAQTDAILAIMTSAIVEQQAGNRRASLGNAHPRHTPHGHYRCAGDDQWVAISVQTEAQRQALTRIVTNDGETDTLDSALRAWTAARPKDGVAAHLLSAGIPAAPVATFEEMSQSPWMQARGFVQTVRHPYIGEAPVYMPPWRFGPATPGKRLPAPLLGADTDDVRRRFML